MSRTFIEIMKDLNDITEELDEKIFSEVVAKPTISEWIPVTERLPEGRTEVIVSCHNDSGDRSYDYTSYGWITTDREYWIVDNEQNDYVIAWQPLPEPYKEEMK